MTRKDYTLLADAFARARQYAASSPDGVMAQHAILMEVCDSLQQDNPRFDRDKFIDAARKVTQ